MRSRRANQSREDVAGDESGSKAKNAEGHACVAKTASFLRDAEQARHTGSQRPAVCSHGEGRCHTRLFHERKSAGVLGGISADGKGYVVAAIFAFDAYTLAEPPYGRVVKKQRFNCDLEKVNECVEAADMREFMGDHCAELHFGQTSERTD